MTHDLPTATDDLYAVLSISRSATADEIRKAYRRQALLLHPDKHSSSSDAERAKMTQKFQAVSFAYAILSDEKKRNRYDRTGSVDDLGFDDGDADALSKYFEELYKGMVTLEKIDEFQEKYIGSVDERSDVLKAYVKRKGDMNLILSDVLFSNCDSEARLLEMIDAAISSGEVPSFPKHASTNTEEARRTRRLNEEKEAKAAEKAQKEMEKSKGNKATDGGKDDTAELQQLLQQRGQKRLQNLVESLEAKYGKKTKGNVKQKKEKTRGKKSNAKNVEEESDVCGSDVEDDPPLPVEPTEEEFKAIQERLFNKSASGNDTGKAKKNGKLPKNSTAPETRRSSRNKK